MSKKYAVCGITLGEFRKITANMSDDAILTARDRDCISLDMVHFVGIKGGDDNLRFVDTIDEVYGGEDKELDNQSKQAVIFCDCD